MKILSVELKNIKSYQDGPVVNFHPEGINFISGKNGSGKSTLLEAVGFALFNHNVYKNPSRLLRNGAKKGEIKVSFLLDGDKVYEMKRVVLSGKTGEWILKERDSELELASREVAVMKFMREKILEGNETDLPHLYSQIIGVPQGEIATYFRLPEKERQRHFDPLMGTESYNNSYKNTSNVDSSLAEDVAKIENDIARLEEQCKDFEVDKARLTELVEKLKAARLNLESFDSELAKLKMETDRLEALEREKIELDKQQGATNSQIDHLTQNLEKLKGELAESTDALSIVELAGDGNHRYIDATEKIADLTPKLEKKFVKEEEKNKLETAVIKNDERFVTVANECKEQEESHRNRQGEYSSDILTKQKDLDQLDRTIQSLEAQEEAMEELVDLVEGLEKMSDDWKSRNERLEEKRTALRLKGEQKAEIEKRIADAPELEKVNEQITDIENKIRDVDEQIGTWKSKIAEYGGFKTGEGICPVTSLPCREIDPNSVKSKIADLEKKVKNRRLDKGKLESEKKALDEQRRIAEKADNDRERIEELENEASKIREEMKLFESVNIAKAIKTMLEKWKDLSKSLGITSKIQTKGADKSPEHLNKILQAMQESSKTKNDDLEGHRKELDSQRERLKEGIKFSMKEHENIVKELKKLEEKKKGQVKEFEANEENRQKVAALTLELASLGVLESELIEARKVQNANREAYSNYQAHKISATRVEALMKEQAQRLLDLSSARESISRIEKRFEEITAFYSEETLAILRKRREDILDERTALGINCQRDDAERSALDNKLKIVEESLSILAEKRADSQILKVVRDASRTIRNVLNDAGPRVAESYRKVVADIANTIFNSINEERADLGWDNEYLITIRDRRGEREFAQLSGGEQMTAALAVQLALAREFSNLGLAMFDEPTTNMDKDRRLELAKIIGRIKETYGFEQLFIISHDEAFETMTEQIIRLEKSDGITRLAEEI